jgi:predicted nucleic acid-binding Zn ribbon protein
MPTYIYETISYETISASPERFEVRQGFGDPALTAHPSTGEPVRRVISGGLAVLPSGTSSSGDTEPGCGPDTCHCGRFS